MAKAKKAEENIGSEHTIPAGTYYSLEGDTKRYSRKDMLSMMMSCKTGQTARFAGNQNNADLLDLLRGRTVYARNDVAAVLPNKKSPKLAFVSSGGRLRAGAMMTQQNVGVVHSAAKMDSDR